MSVPLCRSASALDGRVPEGRAGAVRAAGAGASPRRQRPLGTRRPCTGPGRGAGEEVAPCPCVRPGGVCVRAPKIGPREPLVRSRNRPRAGRSPSSGANRSACSSVCSCGRSRTGASRP